MNILNGFLFGLFPWLERIGEMTLKWGPARGVSQVACRNFKISRVGVLSRLHNAVGNLVTYIWLRQSFVAISFERCRYFLAHVACRNLPWQGLWNVAWYITRSFIAVILDLTSVFSTNQQLENNKSNMKQHFSGSVVTYSKNTSTLVTEKKYWNNGRNVCVWVCVGDCPF